MSLTRKLSFHTVSSGLTWLLLRRCEVASDQDRAPQEPWGGGGSGEGASPKRIITSIIACPLTRLETQLEAFGRAGVLMKEVSDPSGKGGERNLHTQGQARRPTTPLPPPLATDTHTHLSYFGRGDLPFIGTSKHTGDVPVGRQGMVSKPLVLWSAGLRQGAV